MNHKAIQLIETVLILALRKGEAIRFPSRLRNGESFRKDFDVNMSMTIEDMGESDIPWAIQNSALCYVNDVDTSKVWEELHSKQLKAIASNLLSN